MAHQDEFDDVLQDVLEGYKLLNINTSTYTMSISQQHSRFEEFSMYESAEFSVTPHAGQQREQVDAKLERHSC